MNKLDLPIYDKKQIYGGILSNNIKYILIQDNNLDKSYISISIKSGSYNNPENCEGLAHFLEHMLFLGSKKYPNENYFSNKLNDYNGYSNAFTSNFYTTYFLNINNKGLLEILEIFSRFFIDPLFNVNMIQKEINAINNEYLKNINNDMWKMEQFIYDISNKKNFFTTGSLDTLNKPNIKEELINYYNNYYNSDNISICIASSLSIKELYNIILNTFGIIKKKESKKTNIIKPLFNNTLNIYHLKSISDIYNLIYVWDLPSITNYYYKDFGLLENLLLDASNTSLFFKLVKNGLINNIDILNYNEEGIFVIIFQLTELGYQSISENIIQKELFKYINYIINLDLHSYGLYYENINNIKFKYLNNIDITVLCNNLSKNHNYYNTKDCYSGLFNNFNIKTTEEYRTLYKTFINDSNYKKIIQAPYFILDESKYIKNNYYDNEYCILTMENIFFKDIKLDNHKYYICNKKININPVIINNLNEYEKPALINNNQWYGCISRFNEPIIKIWLKFNDHNKFNTPNKYILSLISSNIINLLVSTLLYEELKILLSFDFIVNPIYASYYIIIESYNDIDKLKIILKKIYFIFTNLDKIVLKYLSKTFIHNKINDYKNIFNNINYLTAWDYEEYIFNINVYNYYYHNTILLKELNNIKYNDVICFINKIFYNNIVTSFLYGNISFDNINLLKQFHLLNINRLNFHYISSTIKLFNDIIYKHPNINEDSKCITYYYKIGNFNPKINLLLLLFNNIYNTLFYNILRTKYQFGYLVQMYYKKIKQYYLIYQKIQTNNDMEIVKQKIEEFNLDLINYLETIDINTYINILKDELKMKDYSIDQSYNKYVYEINNHEFLFNKNKLMLNYIDKINKNDIINFINTFINKENRFIIIIN
jgi:insulysin